MQAPGLPPLGAGAPSQPAGPAANPAFYEKARCLMDPTVGASRRRGAARRGRGEPVVEP